MGCTPKWGVAKRTGNISRRLVTITEKGEESDT